MTVKGIAARFDCGNGGQYENIGAFWDCMRALCPGQALSGVGYGWENDSLRYLIGTEQGVPEAALEKVRELWPDAGYASVELPDNGWKTYAGTADTLDMLYAEIYRDGPLDFEIERFDDAGNAVIQIHRADLEGRRKMNEKKKRPVTTLFLLTSVDGKISTGAVDARDVDIDFPKIPGVREGLHQYYEIERTTDLWSLNSGRVQAKIGVNTAPLPEKRSAVSFVVLDNRHLTAHGVRYFAALSKEFVLVTSNPEHPVFSVRAENVHVLRYEQLCAVRMLEDLYERFGCERLTVQTGGTLNALFLREKVLDYVDLVVAPVLVGGRDTASVIDGASLQSAEELKKLGVLRLESAQPLEDSYLRLRYRVIG